MLKNLKIKTGSKTEFIDISGEVQRAISESGIMNGLCCIFIPHTTAGIFVNEGADPAVQRDISKVLGKLVPFEGGYTHAEGNSAAHIKSVLTGTSQTVIIENGKPLLGTWQSIFFCEFDGPRHRSFIVKLIRDDR